MINELIIPVINYLLNVHPKLRERFFQARGLPCQAFRRAKKGRPEAGKTRPQMLPYMLETMAADAHGVFSDASRPEAGKTRPQTLPIHLTARLATAAHPHVHGFSGKRRTGACRGLSFTVPPGTPAIKKARAAVKAPRDMAEKDTKCVKELRLKLPPQAVCSQHLRELIRESVPAPVACYGHRFKDQAIPGGNKHPTQARSWHRLVIQEDTEVRVREERQPCVVWHRGWQRDWQQQRPAIIKVPQLTAEKADGLIEGRGNPGPFLSRQPLSGRSHGAQMLTDGTGNQSRANRM